MWQWTSCPLIRVFFSRKGKGNRNRRGNRNRNKRLLRRFAVTGGVELPSSDAFARE